MRKRTIWAGKAQRDPLFGGLPIETRHAYWTLQCYADDDGRILWNPMYISTCLSFPGVAVSEVDGMMASLVAAGQVLTYEHGVAIYAVFIHWSTEQSVDRPGPPKCPDPPEAIQEARSQRRSRLRAEGPPPQAAAKKDLLGAEPSVPSGDRKAAERKTQAQEAEEAALQEVYGFYCQAFQKTGQYVFSAARRNAIRQQLRDGYDVKACKRAIIGNLHSAWHQGANDRKTAYNDLVFIFKDASRVDDFLDKFVRAKKAHDAGAPMPGADTDESDHQSGEGILAGIFQDGDE